jgi:hypothetical protein
MHWDRRQIFERMRRWAVVAKNWKWQDSNAFLPLTAQPAPFQHDEALSPPAGH